MQPHGRARRRQGTAPGPDPVPRRHPPRLKERFVQFLGAGEVEGDPAGGFRFKVGVQGREGDLGVVWYYYLVASPDGDQLLATFTLAAGTREAVRRARTSN